MIDYFAGAHFTSILPGRTDFVPPGKKYYIIQQTGGQFIDLLFNYILYKDYLL